MSEFPSMKATRLLALLEREPLGYRAVRRSGSHRMLQAQGRRRILFAFHDRDTVPPGLVKRILVKEAGLTEKEALKLL